NLFSYIVRETRGIVARTLFSKCRNAKCNFFCCNCDYKCDRWGGRDTDEELERRRRSAGPQSFNAIDWNGDGVISEDEAREFVFNGTSSIRAKRDIIEGFAEMDVNGDGVIQPGDFDHSL
ncbi:hypothetical protein PMAYCL1PPCAC_21790, partial [Pristionchus mayeri]